MEDDYAVQEFYDARMADGGYGQLLDDNDDFDWRRWQHALYRICRLNRVGNSTANYIDSIHRYQRTFVFALLPMTMRFYLEGIKEWLDYPNPSAIQMFKQNRRQHWTPNLPSHIRSIRTPDYIFMLQSFVYERQNMHLEKDLSATHYDHFANAMWRLTQRFPVYVSEDENIESEA